LSLVTRYLSLSFQYSGGSCLSCARENTGPSLQTNLSPMLHRPHIPIPHFIRISSDRMILSAGNPSSSSTGLRSWQRIARAEDLMPRFFCSPLFHHSSIPSFPSLLYISLIMAMIWPCSNPLKFRAPERHDATQSPHPLQSTGFTSALPANGPSATKDGAE
jgi:hypothetical protein